MCCCIFIFPQSAMDFSFEARESINGALAVHSGYTEALHIVTLYGCF